MSRNFKIGTQVRVKETGEIGIIKGREHITNQENDHVRIEYVVKLGEGMDNWKSFSRRELENYTTENSNEKSIYPQVITIPVSYEKRSIVMVGVIDKVKFDTYVKSEVLWENEDGESSTHPKCEMFINKPFKGKCLSIGWAILHPDDKFDVFVGEKLALRRAKEQPISKLYSSFNGEFNPDIVEEILRDKSEYIFDNLEKFVK